MNYCKQQKNNATHWLDKLTMESGFDTLYPKAHSWRACPICIAKVKQRLYSRTNRRDCTRTVTITINCIRTCSSLCIFETRSLSCLGIPSMKYPHSNFPNKADWKGKLSKVLVWDWKQATNKNKRQESHFWKQHTSTTTFEWWYLRSFINQLIIDIWRKNELEINSRSNWSLRSRFESGLQEY